MIVAVSSAEAREDEEGGVSLFLASKSESFWQEREGGAARAAECTCRRAHRDPERVCVCIRVRVCAPACVRVTRARMRACVRACRNPERVPACPRTIVCVHAAVCAYVARALAAARAVTQSEMT
eukprot:6208708-Pleurochrysis_carterae.AAC.1